MVWNQITVSKSLQFEMFSYLLPCSHKMETNLKYVPEHTFSLFFSRLTHFSGSMSKLSLYVTKYILSEMK